MQKLTAKEINTKYRGKYVDVYECPSWDTDEYGQKLYEVRKVYDEIHENTTLGEDVGTSLEFTR